MIKILYGALLIVIFEVLHLLHYFAENFRAILRRITIFNEADFNIKFQLISDNLIVQPVGKGRFKFNDFFNLLGQAFAFVVDRDACDNFVFAVFKIVLVP